MSRITNRIKGFVAPLMMLIVITALPTTVSATAGNPAYCDAGVDRLTNTNIGNKVPVIMVHGWFGTSQDWGSITDPSSFAGKINAIPGVAVAHLLNYDSSKWVDDQSSGPRLAKTIDCVSQLSQHNGGKGKVIVVGYSMGGLVARNALSHTSTDGQRAIADEVGQVITIGTPHDGTTLPVTLQLAPPTLASAFTTGSPELARLPHFPAQTAVHTIAGDVTRDYYDVWGRQVRQEQPHDDTLVPTISAHAEYTIDVNKGGGQKTISCDKKYYTLPFFNQSVSYQDAPCEHVQLIKNSSNGVREDTVDAINKYVAWLASPPLPSLTINGLTTTYDSRWTNVYYGASGIGQDGSAEDTSSGVPCTGCTGTPVPIADAFIQITNMASWWCSGPVLQCSLGSNIVVGAAPPVTIGGRTPSSSARYYDGNRTGTSLVWCFEDQKLCIQYRRGIDSPQLEPSAALLDLFSTATWSP